MASELRVNTITSTTGVGTVTLGSGGVSFSGTPTFNDVTLSSINGNAISGTRNRIINGDCRISQRGPVNVTFGGGSTYLAADRFTLTNYWGSGQVNTAISNVAPTGISSSLSLTVSTAPPMSGATGYAASLWQAIEGFNISDAYNSNITLSFWVRSSITGTYSLTFSNVSSTSITTGSRLYVTNYTINSSNTWEYKTITLDLSAGTSSGTWNRTNDTGLCVAWNLGSESNRKGDTFLNTWGTLGATLLHLQSGSQTQWITNTNATFQVTGVQLEVGTVATPFERRFIGQELALCQRYFYVLPAHYHFFHKNSYYESQLYYFPVTMRSAPNITDNGSWVLRGFQAGSNTTYSGFSYTTYTDGFYLGSTTTNNNTFYTWIHDGGTIYASAEL